MRTWFDWGDGINSGWTAMYASGATASASHAWNAKGTYQIKVKAKDIHGVENSWSDPLPVQMALPLGMKGAHLLEHLFSGSRICYRCSNTCLGTNRILSHSFFFSFHFIQIM
jgi:hypothetical protein